MNQSIKKYTEYVRESLLNLYFAKLRSFLALLGIVVGTASVVAMVLGGQLATQETLKQFQSLGTNLLAMNLNDTNESSHPIAGKKNALTLEEALNLKSAHPAIITIAPYTQVFYPIYYREHALFASIVGVTDSFAAITHIKLDKGRFISILDKYAAYCVIGQQVYEEIKSISHLEPLGQQLQINQRIFTIIGIADAWPENNFVYANVNTSVLIPLLTSSLLNQHAVINNLILRLTTNAPLEEVKNSLQLTIQRLVTDKNITFRSAKELIIKMKKQNDILTLFLGLIGSIALIVGGIGVMNMMLVAVLERRTEIGIRLAIGARPNDIALLFLIEAIILSFVGGVIGIGLGLLIIYIISISWHWQFVFFSTPLLVGFIVSVVTGILSGFYPAYQAARLDPIVALRNI